MYVCMYIVCDKFELYSYGNTIALTTLIGVAGLSFLSESYSKELFLASNARMRVSLAFFNLLTYYVIIYLNGGPQPTITRLHLYS